MAGAGLGLARNRSGSFRRGRASASRRFWPVVPVATRYGACIAHEVPDDGKREGGGGEAPLHVLVRELNGVPGTQDTRAFVQQRTLPMITRWPGFKGVYMVRSDRDPSRAAVVTLFDGKEQAEAAHGRAVELLKEGLPKVSVTRVVQGQSTVISTGG